MKTYKPTIGLEIHAELKTKTKMFCNSKNDPNEKQPNINICPVCMAHPGTLPTINKEAVKHVLRVGVALGGKLADYTEFDRKSYFYPDLPKGYQISQYEFPLVQGGELCGIKITRVHLEEDTASSVHGVGDATLVDYNRAGVPLMELVTEPVIESAQKAGEFARELQLLLRYLDVSEANMEKGEMRVEANISISKDEKFGTKVEIKNLNSFRVMERAVAFEVERQKKVLEDGGEVVQETRGWDEDKQRTFPQRIKEVSADYRYFPDPDLPKLKLSEVAGMDKKSLESTLPELPWLKKERYLAIGIKSDDADMYVKNRQLGAFFDDVNKLLEERGEKKYAILLASNYIATDLAKHIRDMEERDAKHKAEMPISAKRFLKLITLISEGKISSRGAKDILAEMVTSDADPVDIANKNGLFQKSSEIELMPVIEKIIAENESVVKDFSAGKESSLQFLVGQGMRATKGAANPQVLQRLFRGKISE